MKFGSLFFFALVLCFFFLGFPAAFSAEPAPASTSQENFEVAGRVFTENGPLADARVSAYLSYADIGAGKPAFEADLADEQGSFTMLLPAATYYFVARGSKDNIDYFAFHGNNPIATGGTNLWLAFQATPVADPVAREGGPAISGRVTFKGEPVTDGYVSAYLTSAKTFKGLGYKTESIKRDGTFHLNLPPGDYVLVAKKMLGGGSLRPPQRGDLIGYFAGNPVSLAADREISVEIGLYPKADRTSFTDVPQIRTNTYPTAETIAAVGGSGIAGRVTSADGNPIENIFVLAYPARSEVFQMYHLSHGTTYSARTGKDGRYFVPIDQSGQYNVVARDILGDGPHRGELYGLYQGDAMHQVSYAAGSRLENIDIVAGRTMEEPAVAGDVGLQIPAAAQRFNNPEINSDITILEDTVWSGRVLIRGKVSVKRGATLFLEPGTEVRFAFLDRDQNNIGDGELLIEGRILALGTAENKIRFSSAEPEPKPNDYSYVNVLATAGAPSIFEHCEFRHGFSGMQLHYSNVEIRNSLFEHNGEGLHWNTVNLLVEDSTFRENGVGIKFSRQEGKVLVRRNLVTDNAIGVQFVHQHINAVDFDNLNKVIEPPVFEQNNIFNNRKYNFSMGDRQEIDITVAGNWWGSGAAAEIEPTLFDRLDDDELGQVFFEPFLDSPVDRAGTPN